MALYGMDYKASTQTFVEATSNVLQFGTALCQNGQERWKLNENQQDRLGRHAALARARHQFGWQWPEDGWKVDGTVWKDVWALWDGLGG